MAAHVGHYLSGAGHAALIGWALFGGMFRAAPLPPEVAQVSVVSEAEFLDMFASSTSPSMQQDNPTLTPPEDTELAMIEPSAPDAKLPEPETPQVPPQEQAAEPPEVPQPVKTPVASVDTEQPQLTPQQDQEPTLDAKPSDRPAPKPIDRVAPVPRPPAPEDVAVDLDKSVATAPDKAEVVEKKETKEAVQQEAAKELVPETAEKPASGAPKSVRPMARPKALVTQKPKPKTEPKPQTGNVADAVAAALQSAQSSTSSKPSGAPLSASEKGSFRSAVERCRTIDDGSKASQIEVLVAMQMQPDGKVVPGSIQLVSADSNDTKAVNVAFQTIRRNILRCQGDGYNLPKEKYDHWREIELRFSLGQG